MGTVKVGLNPCLLCSFLPLPSGARARWAAGVPAPWKRRTGSERSAGTGGGCAGGRAAAACRCRQQGCGDRALSHRDPEQAEPAFVL